MVMNEKMKDPEPGETSVEDLDVSTGDEDDHHSQIEPAVPSDESVRRGTPPSWTCDNRATYWILGAGCVATAMLGAFTMLITNYNRNTFFFEFQSFARGFHDNSKISLDNIMGHLQIFGISATSENVQHNAAPNITLHNFDRRAQEIGNFSGIEMLLYVPIIDSSSRAYWESYTVQNQGWIAKDYKYRGWNASNIKRIREQIYDFDFNITSLPDNEQADVIAKEAYIRDALPKLGYTNGRPFTPISQFGPAVVDSSLVMMDLFSHPTFGKEMSASMQYKHTSLSKPMDLSLLLDCISPQTNYSENTKRSFILHPVKKGFKKDTEVVGFLVGVVSWEEIFRLKLPPNVNGLDVVVKNACGDDFTFVANGGKPSTFSNGDNHDSHYDRFGYETVLYEAKSEIDTAPGDSQCYRYRLVIYPTSELENSFDLINPMHLVGFAALLLIVCGGLFSLHMKYSQQRQAKILEKAQRAEAIVTSVFPQAVGRRLIEQAEEAERPIAEKANSRKMLNTFLAKNDGKTLAPQQHKPIADFFPNTTVMFADIVGFTAWSSTREPSQVFILLETVYEAFDIEAKKRDIFKVETVGDCYVAVCGLPEPRKDHMVCMALYADNCLATMAAQVQSLEVDLGPDTADLGIRIGLHSGPVTAGVLRGDRARFQLFGDTMNTCARIESSGERSKVHLSKETADLLTKMGKSNWIYPRNGTIYAKGKGQMQTFWIRPLQYSDDPSISPKNVALPSAQDQRISRTKAQHRVSLYGSIERRTEIGNQKKFDRLVSWNVDVLITLLKQVTERREALGTNPEDEYVIKTVEEELSVPVSQGGKAAFDEVVESIEIATFNAEATSRPLLNVMEMRGQIQNELREFVQIIASMYNDNPFHNFEHASHVTMSVMKLLNRIVAPDIGGDESQLHDHTYGITSDPLTQFAVVFSALLHDLDHLGVPNTQLVKDVPELSRMYKNKSVAEQNSIDLAWALLMEDRFSTLRRSIYSTTSELRRFRQLVVNTVLATDIMDKELKALRNIKWAKAFSQQTVDSLRGSPMNTNNRKATVVIEHLIQASDIAHTMQHWQVYRKWNQRLFKEMYRAYCEGHADKDPSEGWYQGEIGFFDFYIIPLAKKLDECGVFGVSSHEYLNYAEQNRKEWEKKGKRIVADSLQEAKAELLGSIEPEFDM